jgi:hypothetical protein
MTTVWAETSLVQQRAAELGFVFFKLVFAQREGRESKHIPSCYEICV